MNNYRYSVVIPHYNSSKLLQRMIASIPARDDVQVIVADDCSKDEEYEAIRKIEHKNLEIYRLDSNGGAGAARNLGLSHVEGEWVTFVDSDDTFADCAFNVFDENIDPKLDYLCYFVKAINDETGDCINRSLISENSVRSFYTKANKTNKNLFQFRNNVCWNKLVRVDFIKKFDIGFEECKVNNDVLYALLVGLYGQEYKIIPQELYVWRENMTSMTRTKRSIEREFLFYLQAQKRNGLFKAVGLKRYPFYRSDFLYTFYFIKKMGLINTARFLKYKNTMLESVKSARKVYTDAIEPLFFIVNKGLWCRLLSMFKILVYKLNYGRMCYIPMSTTFKGNASLTIINGGGYLGKNILFGTDCSVICNKARIEIGDDTVIANHVNIQAVDGRDIVIGKVCKIGSNVKIQPGVKIGDKCIIRAGCVVDKDIPEGNILT